MMGTFSPMSSTGVPYMGTFSPMSSMGFLMMGTFSPMSSMGVPYDGYLLSYEWYGGSL